MRAHLVTPSSGRHRRRSARTTDRPGTAASTTSGRRAAAEYDAIHPCGGAAVERLQEQDEVTEFIRQAFKHCKPIAAAGAAVELLGGIDHPELELAGTDSGDVTSSHGVVTAGTGADVGTFAQAFVEAIGRHRHWSRELVGMVG